MSTARLLKSHELFQSLTVEQIDTISRFSTPRTCQKDDVVFREGDMGTHLYIVLEGVVHLRLPAGTPEVGIVIAKPRKGDFFGLSPLLGSPRYTLTAQCITTTELLAVDVRRLRAILIENSVAGINVMSSVARTYFTRYVELTRRLQAMLEHIALDHA